MQQRVGAGKVIYVAFAPVTSRIRAEWFIDTLLAIGIPVEYWDLASFLDGIVSDDPEPHDDISRVVSSYAEFEELLRRPENHCAVCVMLMGYGGRFVPVYRAVSASGCRMLYIEWGYLPQRSAQIWSSRWASLLKPGQAMNRIFDKARAVAFRRAGLVAPYDVVFTSAPDGAPARFNARKIVPINSTDYDHFVAAAAWRDGSSATLKAVFLDINLPFQSDLKFEKVSTVAPAHYFASLARFFDLVEERFGVEVVIAGHPKSRYQGTEFGRRRIVRGMTAQLVKGSVLVLSHHSASVAHAVLAELPIIFCFTAGMLDLYRYVQIAMIRDLADYLDRPLYNVDEIASPMQIERREPDLKRYARFKYSFLTNIESEHTVTRDVFCGEVSRLLPRTGEASQRAGGARSGTEADA